MPVSSYTNSKLVAVLWIRIQSGDPDSEKIIPDPGIIFFLSKRLTPGISLHNMQPNTRREHKTKIYVKNNGKSSCRIRVRKKIIPDPQHWLVGGTLRPIPTHPPPSPVGGQQGPCYKNKIPYFLLARQWDGSGERVDQPSGQCASQQAGKVPHLRHSVSGTHAGQSGWLIDCHPMVFSFHL